MKTKSNVQKATTKLLALGLIMVLGMGVYASGIEKPVSKKENSQESAFAMYGLGALNQLTTDMDVFASYLEPETEPTLEVEDWMTDENSFDVYAAYNQLDQEEALEVEDWMKDESTFYPSNSDFTTAPDPEPELEEWMTAEEVWNL